MNTAWPCCSNLAIRLTTNEVISSSVMVIVSVPSGSGVSAFRRS